MSIPPKGTDIAQLVEQAVAYSGLSRRALAARAQLSPETVSRISTRGTGDFATVARLIRSAGLKLTASVPGQLPAESRGGASDHERLDARSLALHCLIAGKLLAQPLLLASKVLPTIRRFKEAHAGTGSEPLLAAWESAAAVGAAEVARICMDPSETGKQLRQASPMTGLLRANERRWVYEAFTA